MNNSEHRLRICYDGQIGNREELQQKHYVNNGPFLEERILLTLYEKYGPNMCAELSDAIFAFVIVDGHDLLAARDMLGIKTLFYGKKNGGILFGSELKSISVLTEDVFEFPNGCFMTTKGHFTCFAKLPEKQPEKSNRSVDEPIASIRNIIKRSVDSRIDFKGPTASLLSGGIDSSVVAFLASASYKKRFGQHARLPTFTLGVNESGDILNARIMAEHLDSDHHELIVDLDQILSVLSEVIYYLESYDPSLVRSAVSNFLISSHARSKGFDLLISGEGGDELFCGYHYLKDLPAGEIFKRQMECLGFLHNNAALRLDRMNHCHSVRVVAPLISGELLQYAMTIPSGYKLMPDKNGIIEKWIFRKAFENDLPREIVWRLKKEFSQGSGAADVLPSYFESVVTDGEFSLMVASYPFLRSKEESFYFKLFKKHFGDGKAAATVGQWLTL
ncbi:MAG TPA: asparagine synthase-related protein [Desulfobacterales bacterium]|nr:asparagine synthase-related protein [Desulfobacterales bacterium]